MRKVLLIVVAGVGVYWYLVLGGHIRFEPDPDEVLEASKDVQSAPPTAPDPRVLAAKRWMLQSGSGSPRENWIPTTTKLPDWSGGSRLRARDGGKGYIFYFDRAGQLCSVWSEQPRERIHNVDGCGE